MIIYIYIFFTFIIFLHIPLHPLYYMTVTYDATNICSFFSSSPRGNGFLYFVSRVAFHLPIGFMIFFRIKGHSILTCPQNTTQFLRGHFTKVSLGPLFWHMKAVVTSVWSQCQGVASKRHEEISVFQGRVFQEVKTQLEVDREQRTWKMSCKG